MTLYTLSTEGGAVHVQNVQVVSYRGEMYQYQRRYADEGGAELVGHFMVDDRDNWVEMRGDHLRDFQLACDALAHKQRTTSIGELPP